ncbi:MAG: hypothetical protein FWC55_07995 [Firmicutes bacterium]|nr:hypothetical protein [Bacillota bacterium]
MTLAKAQAGTEAPSVKELSGAAGRRARTLVRITAASALVMYMSGLASPFSSPTMYPACFAAANWP